MTLWTPPPETALKGVKRCHKTDCSSGLHCFVRGKKQGRKLNTPSDGSCAECSATPVEWKRLHRRNVDDIEFLRRSLDTERIRYEFRHVSPLTQFARDSATRFRERGLHQAAVQRITSTMSKDRGRWDGRQTPLEDKGDILHFAQHGMACCCRQCAFVWHGIARGRELRADEVEYMATLLVAYVNERSPASEAHER